VAKIILITGGTRSGKSDFAEQHALGIAGDWLYLATCPPAAGDQEMEERITAHKNRRQGRGWQSIEAEIEVAEAIAAMPEKTNVLLDCLTLWISNMLLAAEGDLSESDVKSQCQNLLNVCQAQQGTFIMVSGEVGYGIVPENRLARRYRDLVGRCNQIIAAAAHEVYLVSCGIPVKIK
jgi:adenosylcobinamide kinase/adenosylcobinamide-phosphate guanylyltransferase